MTGTVNVAIVTIGDRDWAAVTMPTQGDTVSEQARQQKPRPRRRPKAKPPAEVGVAFPAPSDGPNGSRRLQVQLSRIEFDPRVNVIRRPRVFPERPDDFERKQDYLTFAPDLFWDASGTFVHAICPSVPEGLNVTFRALPGLRRCRVRLTRLRIDHFRIMAPPGARALEVNFGAQREIVAIQPNLQEAFAGRRVLLAISRNNDLQWIVDWAHFYAVHHGVDAVVLYDNRSTAYTSDDVARALAVVPGLSVFSVIDWAGGYGYGIGSTRIGAWGQRTALEHGIRRLLPRAEWVISADIDELLVPSPGVRLDELFAQHEVASLRFPRVNVVAIDGKVKPNRRHLDFSWTDDTGFECKSVVRPSRLPDAALIRPHGIFSAAEERLQEMTNALRFAHFLPLTTGWRHDWRLSGRSATDPDVSHDDQLREALDAALKDGPVAPSPWTPLEGESPGLARIEAERLAAAGDLRGALAMIEHAIKLAPDDVRHREWREGLLSRMAGDANG